MGKLQMPAGVRTKPAASGQPQPAVSPAASETADNSTVVVRAPAEGETVNLTLEKAEGGHILRERRHDRNYNTRGESTRVVTGSPSIRIEADKA